MVSDGTRLREEFLLDPSVTFLNHGSYGATPRAVFERYQEWQLELERQPVLFIARRPAMTLPVGVLCRRAREAGIRPIVDGAHAPAHLPLNLRELDADYYAGNCHK
jgi:kynureninase